MKLASEPDSALRRALYTLPSMRIFFSHSRTRAKLLSSLDRIQEMC